MFVCELSLLSIDSGIDWQHPTLGGALGPGNKVIGGKPQEGCWLIATDVLF